MQIRIDKYMLIIISFFFACNIFVIGDADAMENMASEIGTSNEHMLSLNVSSTNKLASLTFKVKNIDQKDLESTIATQLSFSLTNSGTNDFITTPIATNYNRIVIVKPGGEEIEEYVWKDGIKPIIIKPSQLKTWTRDILEIFKFHKIKERGVYQVYWKIDNVKSQPFTVVIEERIF